jgi:hypothetical protein
VRGGFVSAASRAEISGAEGNDFADRKPTVKYFKAKFNLRSRFSRRIVLML